MIAVALASGATRAEAAKRANVGESTVFRRLRDAAFRARVQQLRGELVTQTVGRLAEAGAEAVTALANLIKHADGKLKARAASIVLAMLFRGRELVDVEERLRALEGDGSRPQEDKDDEEYGTPEETGVGEAEDPPPDAG